MPNFRRRKLAKNHNCEQPSRIVCIDCETIPLIDPEDKDKIHHNFRLGVTRYAIRDGKRWKHVAEIRHLDRHQLWGYIFGLARQRSVLTVYAHNAVFDLTVSDFWAYVDGGEIILHGDLAYHTGRIDEPDDSKKQWKGLFVVDDRRCIIEAAHRNGRIDIVDSMNYYKGSLAKLGESVGLAKIQMPGFDADDDIWFDYCSRDCEIVERAMTRLMDEWKEEDYGNWQSTVSGLADSCYRHKWLHQKLSTHDDEIATCLESESHFGGECRAFFIGHVNDEYDRAINAFNGQKPNGSNSVDGPVYMFDVRSLYPWVMKTYPLPYQLLFSYEKSTLEEVHKATDEFHVIAAVRLDTSADRYPYRDSREGQPRWNDRLLFPTGKYGTVLCGPELRDAFHRGCVQQTYAYSVYSHANLFAGYVDHFWAKRKSAEALGDGVQAEFCKLMLNSLYGRFGMRGKRWEIEPSVECVHQWGAWIHVDDSTGVAYRCKGIGGNALVEKEMELRPHSLLAVAGAITAWGRTRMRMLRNLCPEHSVLYQDTDSLMVTAEGRESLERVAGVVGNDLGQLALKGKHESVDIVGQRNYSADGNDIIAGLPTRRTKIRDRVFSVEVFEQAESILSRACADTVAVVTKNMDFKGSPGGDLPMVNGWTVPVNFIMRGRSSR